MGVLVPSFMLNRRDSVFITGVYLYGENNREKRKILKGGEKADAVSRSRRVTSVVVKSKKPEVCHGNHPKIKERGVGRVSGDGAEPGSGAAPSPQLLVECESALGSAQ